MSTSAAGYSLTGRDKATPEDRWAIAELDGLTFAAVADGVSDPTGSGRPGASGAVADVAVATFVDQGSRLVEAGLRDPASLVAQAFEAASNAAEIESRRHPERGGAAFIGTCLAADGRMAISKVGDCRARVLRDDGWTDGAPSDDADRRGGLTDYLGHPSRGATTPSNPITKHPVVEHHHIRAAMLMTDGAWRQNPELPLDADTGPPFILARDVVARARRLGEGDDLTAVVLQRREAPSTLTFESRLSPLMLVVAALLFLLAGFLLASAFTPAHASDRAHRDTHHILILDDSGSMESDFDVHGFGLAIPQLFHRVLGDRATDDLSVLLLAQRVPFGTVPRLAPSDYLTYARENGTFYGKSIEEALRIAASSPAKHIEIALITDAEPRDRQARRVLDEALAKDPRITFSCFQLGTSDSGDLCVDRSSFATDGFELTQVLTMHLARSLGSLPRWGRLDPRSLRETPLPLARFVSKMHVIALGARAGEDFAADLVTGSTTTPLLLDYTRPMMALDQLQMLSRRGFRPDSELPIGPSPRLALATLTVVPTTAGASKLRLRRADGAVAWGVILEYDLVASATGPLKIEASSKTFPVEAYLSHATRRIDTSGAADLATLGLQPKLTITPECPPQDSCPSFELDAPLGPDATARFEVPAAATATRWTLVARFVSDTAHLEAPPLIVERDRPALTALSELPPTPAPAPSPTPTQAPYRSSPLPSAEPSRPSSGGPTGPSPAPSPTPALTSTPTLSSAPTPTIARWIPPTLDLPDHLIEGTELGYALTVTTHDGKTLTGSEITAEGLSAILVYDGQRLPMPLVGDRFELRFPAGSAPTGPTPREAYLELVTPTDTLTSNRDTTTVLPDQALAIIPALELGLVPAGCGLTDRCVPVELGASRRMDQPFEVLRLTPTDLAVTLRRGDETWLLTAAPVVLSPSPLALEACLAPPGCTTLDSAQALTADGQPTLSETLIARPSDPRLQTPDRTSMTRLHATLIPSPWLTCNLWWIVLVISILLFLFIVYGYLRPDSFSAGALLQVADQERRLAKDPGRPLRTLPHGRRGFYRTATCAIDASGYTVKRSRPHVVQLRADRRSIALLPKGAVERKVRGRWVPVDRSAERYVLSGTIYRVNQAFVFRVLA